MRTLLAAPDTTFLVVAAPTSASADESAFLADRLSQAGMSRAGVIVNRVHPLDPAGADEPATMARLAPAPRAGAAGNC